MVDKPKPELRNADDVSRLERMLLELGSEVYRLKATLHEQTAQHEQMVAVFKGVRRLLDDKGVITSDDFDAAVDLGTAVEFFENQAEQANYEQLERLKKTSH